MTVKGTLRNVYPSKVRRLKFQNYYRNFLVEVYMMNDQDPIDLLLAVVKHTRSIPNRIPCSFFLETIIILYALSNIFGCDQTPGP